VGGWKCRWKKKASAVPRLRQSLSVDCTRRRLLFRPRLKSHPSVDAVQPSTRPEGCTVGHCRSPDSHRTPAYGSDSPAAPIPPSESLNLSRSIRVTQSESLNPSHSIRVTQSGPARTQRPEAPHDVQRPARSSQAMVCPDRRARPAGPAGEVRPGGGGDSEEEEVIGHACEYIT
jgi:hypothetical protein